MTFEQQMHLTLIGAVAGGFVGFVLAYLMARLQRRWDLEKEAAKVRQSRIDAIRVPLEIIRDEIQRKYQLQAHFNRGTELVVLRQIGEAVYTLGGTDLIRAFENAMRPLHEYAQTDQNPKTAGEKCLAPIEEILKALGTPNTAFVTGPPPWG